MTERGSEERKAEVLRLRYVDGLSTRAIAKRPEILLCDEPTSALDPELAGEVTEVLVGVASEGTTMIDRKSVV